MTATSMLPFPKSFRYSIGLIVVFNAFFLLWVLFRPGTHDTFVIGDDIGQALGWLLATLLCFVGFRRSWPVVRRRSNDTSPIQSATQLVPLFLALGIFCQCIGQIIYTYYDFHHWNPFPSWADVAYLSTYPFLLTGVLLLPTQPLAGITRWRVIVDGFMIMTALVTFSWYFVLGPNMLQGHESIFATIVGSAYPFFDLVLIFCVLRLSFLSRDPALQLVVRLLSIGLVIIVITDSIYDYQTLQNSYVNGWLDLGWPIGYMLIGLAAQTFTIISARLQRVDEQNDVSEASPPGVRTALSLDWHALMPYALVPAVVVLTISTWMQGMGPLQQGVYLGGTLLIGLVVLRQFFSIRETIFYNTQLRSMQQELRQKNQALSEANERLEAQATQVAEAYEQQLRVNELKDQFLLNVNHELRTPLTEIHGYLNLLSEYQGKIDTQMQETFLNHAVHGCEELLDLVNNVLNAIRGDALTSSPLYKEFALAGVVHEVFELFEPQKRIDHETKMDIPESLLVYADRQFLHRVLLNLLSNAFKYSPKHSEVMIRAWVEYDDDSKHTPSFVHVCVQDAGPGIPASEIPLLFGKFVRLKRDLVGTVRGTGLGLYISKQLVEAMGGRIWVESAGIMGQGSQFCFTLPVGSSVPEAQVNA